MRIFIKILIVAFLVPVCGGKLQELVIIPTVFIFWDNISEPFVFTIAAVGCCSENPNGLYGNIQEGPSD